MTDAGLANLSELRPLVQVKMNVMQCTDLGLSHLQNRLTPVTHIEVSSCSPRKLIRLRQEGRNDPGRIDDAVIARLAFVKNLGWIGLRGTSPGEVAALTSAAIQSLKSMPTLSGLHLNGIQ